MPSGTVHISSQLEIAQILTSGKTASRLEQEQYLTQCIQILGLGTLLKHILDRDFDGQIVSSLSIDQFSELVTRVREIVHILEAQPASESKN